MTGPEIRAARRELGLPLKKFAAMARINVCYLSEIERGLRNADPVRLRMIIAAIQKAKGNQP